MIDVFVLNQNLDPLAVIDDYKSLIWANRYAEIGDCELYLAASRANIDLLKIGYYLCRLDDDMVCRIKKVEVTTDAENGDYVTITGEDTKSYLDQRIVWGTATCNGKVEIFVRKLVRDSLIASGNTARDLYKPNGGALLKLGALSGLADVTSEQVSYKNIGEKAREYCQAFGWGYKVTLDDDMLAFAVYKGTDRQNTVIFSDDYENLSTTDYIVDKSNMGNVALVAGEGEGAKRVKSSIGEASGTGRFEIYTDARDISKELTYRELVAAYPLQADGGQGYIGVYGDEYLYEMASLDVLIMSSAQKAWLIATYPSGQIVTVDGDEYYRITNVTIADLQSASPQPDDSVTIRNVIYIPFLLARGADDLAEFGAITSFNGEIIPDVTFIYKQDYYLGDIVTVRNEYGIEKAVRIVEVVEVQDENGYSFTPKFETIERG